MKHLETFEAAASFLNKDTEPVLSVLKTLPEAEGKPLIALYKLGILSEAAWAVQGVQLDWSDSNQWKYYPWFRMSGSGSGFSFSYSAFDYDHSVSSVGSRLVFPSSDMAIFMGKTHRDIYKDLHLK